MGEAEVRPIVLKKTQESLGRFVKKPPLTDKLLKKPPFRFLHDIITAVIRQHGLMEGLFTAEEMISDNVKDKERKIAFLQKVIDTMRLLTGAQLNVRPSKIVAGQEAERTNELLQAIGKALERRVNSKKAVEQVLAALNTDVTPQPQPEVVTSKPEKSSKSFTKSKTKESTTKDKKIKEDAAQVNGKPRRTKQAGDSKASTSTKERKSKENAPAGVEPEILTAPVIPEPSAPELTPESSLPPQSLPESADLLESTGHGLATTENALSLNPAVSSAVESTMSELGAEEPGIAVLGGVIDQQQTSAEDIKPPSATVSRAPSATPSRVPTAIAATPRPPSVRPGSARPRPITARPAAPRLKERLVRPAREEALSPVNTEAPSNLIPDVTGVTKDEDEDATFVVEEAPATIVSQDVNEETGKKLDPTMVPEHAGHLVSQILGAQRELEPQRESTSAEEETSGWHAGGETWRQSEISRLREAVQGLVRAANPLGRLLDFLQEDVEAMQLELETWQSENRELRSQITREARATAESVAPLQRELATLTTQTEQQYNALVALRTTVLNNEKRLTEMLLQ